MWIVAARSDAILPRDRRFRTCAVATYGRNGYSAARSRARAQQCCIFGYRAAYSKIFCPYAPV